MKSLFVLILAATSAAQSAPQIQHSPTTESLRGVSAVSREVAWASGTHGTYLRTTDAGHTWQPAQVPGAAALDFRAVVAFSADEAFLMSAGPGDQSRIYHTADAGQHWTLQFTNTNPKGFFDSMVFWDSRHGIVLGDPIPDENGKLKFEILLTEDGQSWHQLPPAPLPEAEAGEGAFAASNTCIAILRGDQEKSGGLGQDIWFATGGKTARVFHSPDRGQTWQAFDTPIIHGSESAGIFSIAFRDPLHGVIAGGDYKRPKAGGPDLAFTEDGGRTWTLSTLKPQAYFSAIAYDVAVNRSAIEQRSAESQTEQKKKKIGVRPEQPQRLFIVGQDSVLDFRPPSKPRRMNAPKKPPISFNAVSPYPEGGALVVGPNGSIISIL
jgi:photosystem II stability/assembly factor-like uncharacterized protein